MSEDEKPATRRPRKEVTPPADENVEKVTEESSEDEELDLIALKDELVRLRKELAERNKEEDTSAPKTGKFLIHMVNDGLTLLGKVWYRGQELEFDTNSQAYKDTCDMNGFSVLELRRNPKAQEDLYGKVMFREGPWTGKTFADMKYEALKNMANQTNDGDDVSVTVDELMQLEKLDKLRRSKPEALAPILGSGPQRGN